MPGDEVAVEIDVPEVDLEGRAAVVRRELWDAGEFVDEYQCRCGARAGDDDRGGEDVCVTRRLRAGRRMSGFQWFCQDLGGNGDRPSSPAAAAADECLFAGGRHMSKWNRAAWAGWWALCAAALGSSPSAAAQGVEPLAGDAQEQEAPPSDSVVVSLRVAALLGERRVSVDRGRVDGLAVGDVVWLLPRNGGRFRADVVAVDERTAVIEVPPGELPPSPGTRGEVTVPRERLGEEVAPSADAAGGTEGEAAPVEPALTIDSDPRPPIAWRREDEGFTEDMPLLGGIDGVRPKDRTPFLTGRAWAALDGAITSDNGRSQFLGRAGTDIAIENGFGYGELVDIRLEFERYRFDRPELDDRRETTLRLERFSYRIGGTRFEPDGLQFGRFLQSGAPQFGVLDGAEWWRRVDEHHAFGASAGFMPEPDSDYESGHDFQLGGWYRWTSDATELAAAQVGLQKTFHDGAADRDLVIANGHWLPRFGWQWFGSMELDVYSGGDAKGPGLSFTRLFVSASPYTAGAWGLDLTYAYSELPDVERDEVLPFVPDNILQDERQHRLGGDLWLPIGEDTRFVQRLGFFDDADETGGDLESGVEIDGILGRGSRLRPVFFAVLGDYTDVWGTRAWLSFGEERFTWDLFYELANYDQQGFDADNDNFVQHRLRTSVSFRPTQRLSITSYVDGTSYNDERGIAAGVFAQWTF